MYMYRLAEDRSLDIFIDERLDGKTVLQVIKSELPISYAHLKHLKFTERGILVNGTHATVRRLLCKGDTLSLATEDGAEVQDSERVIPNGMLSLSVVYEDSDCIIPSKPSEMPTHPSHGHTDDTVANALAYVAAQRGEPFVFRPVNRLDRNTSGLLMIAKNRIAAGILSKAMAEGKIKKVYMAILKGELPQSEGYIDTYMRRTAESIIVRENCREGEGGDRALTKYRVLLAGKGYSVVAASPITGRTHQLRVHFSGLGAPILGDDMYGEASPVIGRQALHSALLSFPRVCDGKRMTATSPLPVDIKKAALEIFGNEFDEGALLDSCGKLLDGLFESYEIN